jgi:hypothetical protein
MMWMGKPEVLVVTMVPGLRNCSTRASRLRLISRFSETASMIQSASASFARSSSKLPVWIRRLVSRVKKAAGRDLRAASKPACTTRFRERGSPAAGNIEQKAWDSGVGEVRGDARAHGSRAEYRGLLNSLFHDPHDG